MLTVTRKTGEGVIIGQVEITVLRSKDGEVKLGIESPVSMPVYLRSTPVSGGSEVGRESIGKRVCP